MQNATLKSGSGWWDVTSHPYGGNFKRVPCDTRIQLTGKTDKRAGLEFTLNGRTGWAMFEHVVRDEVA